jgi:flagellar protein FlbD
VITVTRLGGGALVVNADLIVMIEQNPDTVISLANGDKLFVRETPDQLIDRIVGFRQRAARLPACGSEGGALDAP